MKHDFLSPSWIAAAEEIRAEYGDRVPHPTVAVRLNLVVTDAPDGGEIRAHIDTTSGRTSIHLHPLDEADVTVTTDYATARSIFAEGDQQAAMAAFLSGRIRVEGDVAKLLLLQAQQNPDTSPLAAEIAARVRDITLG